MYVCVYVTVCVCMCACVCVCSDPLFWVYASEIVFSSVFWCPTENAYMAFESVMYPGQRLGILPDGTVKDPTQTGTGPHGRFIPIIISGVSSQ